LPNKVDVEYKNTLCYILAKSALFVGGSASRLLHTVGN